MDDIETDNVHPGEASIRHDHPYHDQSLVCQSKMEKLLTMVKQYEKKVTDLEEELRQLRLTQRAMKFDDIRHNDSKVSV